VAAYYELYERGYKFMGPWISRQSGNSFTLPPDTATIANCVGKPRSVIHTFAYNAFIESLHKFAANTKGRKQLIYPDASTHHSAQFPRGTFSIEKMTEDVKLAGYNRANNEGPLHKISIFGTPEAIYVPRLKLNCDDIGFIIVRPKLGKLGTASAINWEVLFYKTPHGYLIDHVDSHLNTRYAGTF
jgi:hypothetical protein